MRRKPFRVPTYEELYGPQPDLSDRPDVKEGIERLRQREQQQFGAPSPAGRNPITG